jgi:hypothetical protein
MNIILLGLVLGVVAGVIDIIPMLAMKLPLIAELSAFSMWVVIGFFIASADFGINGIAKGVIVALLVLLPNFFLIGENKPAKLVPVLIMTVVLC